MTPPTTYAGWPLRPDTWPDVMDDIQVCQYLHLDKGRSPETAKRTLRYIRQKRRLPTVPRLGGKLLFRRQSVDRWLADEEKKSVSGSPGSETRGTLMVPEEPAAHDPEQN